MPPHTNTAPGDRPRTRSKNASVHPGKAAQEALRVNAPRRDPSIIQKEKEAAQEKKALKVQEKEANHLRNEATKSITDEFRAEHARKQAKDEEEMPRKTSKGNVSVLDIPLSDYF